jgi:RNA-directed DNA polymerase
MERQVGEATNGGKKVERKTVKTFSSTILSEAQSWAMKGTQSSVAKLQTERPMFPKNLMEEVVHAENVKQALKRVESNDGSPGVDGIKVEGLREYLKQNWLTLRRELLCGEYKPKPLRKVEIPKPGGGVRELGIPTALDRFIQQAILQTVQPKWDKTFSEHSYGFRPGRSAHQAVAKAQGFITEGYTYVVDIDLEKFFDRVNHDMLMGRLAKRIEDKRVLKLIRAFLNAGVLDQGLVRTREEGTPQGGPLSPWLSNVVLDDLDRELEKRGHRFVRYADDCNIYVKSERAGDRVMTNVSEYITRKLKLKVNESKSAVARPGQRKFLGFSFTTNSSPKRRIAPQALEKFKIKIRVITNRNRGRSVAQVVGDLSRYLRGWIGYFGYCQTKSVLRELDSWICRRLRSMIWRQWKKWRRRQLELRKRGVRTEEAMAVASSGRGPWRLSHTVQLQKALPDSYFASLGLPKLATAGNI